MMIAHGVRHNDFGIVTRANRYYNDPIISTSDSADSNVTTETDSLKSNDKNRSVSGNNTNIGSMIVWLGLCCTVGVASYAVVDAWVSYCLARRIASKYLRPRRSKAE